MRLTGVICPTVRELWSMGGGYLAPCLHTGPVFLDSVLLTGPSCRAGQTQFLLQFQWQDLNPTLFPTLLIIRSPFRDLISWAQANSAPNSSLKVPGARVRDWALWVHKSLSPSISPASPDWPRPQEWLLPSCSLLVSFLHSDTFIEHPLHTRHWVTKVRESMEFPGGLQFSKRVLAVVVVLIFCFHFEDNLFQKIDILP